MDVNQASQIAVDRIIADLSDRRGFGQEWDQIDQDLKGVIREEWRIIIEQSLAGLQNPSPLSRDIAQVLNRHSAENGSNTPDFILSDFLTGCLASYDSTQARRERWYGRSHAPGEGGSIETSIAESLESLTQRSRTALAAATTVEELHDIRAAALGKYGELTGILQRLAQVSADRRLALGQLVNNIRDTINGDFEARLPTLRRSV